MATITGTSGNDTLVGTSEDDLIEGLEGDDQLFGDLGNDTIDAGTGGDFVEGGDGNDLISGSSAVVYAEFRGNAGDDTIDGGGGSQTWILGYSGNDQLSNGLISHWWDPTGVVVNLSTSSQLAGGTPIAARQAIDGWGGLDQLGENIESGEASQFDDYWFGSDLPSTTYGHGGNDSISTGGGDDQIMPGSGSDTVDGGAGLDVIDFATGSEIDVAGQPIQGIEVNLVIGVAADGWGEVDTLTGIETVRGSSLGDSVIGDSQDNSFFGRAGNDTLAGGVGDDFLAGDQGDDHLQGDVGTDTAAFNGEFSEYRIELVAGELTVTDLASTTASNVNDGVDRLSGVEQLSFWDRAVLVADLNLATNDTIDLSGPGGGDAEGGDGNDTFIVDDPLDNPIENPGEGIDTVQSSIDWTLGANLENLLLTGTEDLAGTGNTLNNSIAGNSGRNTLDGGAGADTLQGSAGGDTYYLDDPGDVVIESAVAATQRASVAALIRAERGVDGLIDRPLDAGEDADTIVASMGRALLSAYVESGVLAEGSAARELIGNVLANTIDGNSAGNLLEGGEGDDTLAGGEGIDVAAYAGDRADYTVTVTQSGVTVTDNQAADGNEAVDTLTGIEVLRFADQVVELAGVSVGSGSAQGETLLLDGVGAQAAAGGPGNDSYVVNAPGDATVERADEGIDTVKSSVSWTLWEHVEHLTLTGTAAVDGVGNSVHNRLAGNTAENRLTGYAGDDTLIGGAGTDTLLGGPGADTYVVTAGDRVTELSGGGSDTLQSAIAWTLPKNVEKLVLTGTQAVNGTGNKAANTLTGNVAGNVLSGLGGADTVMGGDGNDSLKGGGGNDKLTGGPGADAFLFDTAPNKMTNKDTITDFGADDVIRFDDDIFTAFDADASTTLNASAFRSGDGVTTAADADDRILYDTATGALYYDADGTGVASASVQFAVLTGAPTLTAADFVIAA